MKKFVALLLVGVCGITALAGADSKPVLLLGQNYDSNQVVKNILQPSGIQYEVSRQWVKPQEYRKYAVVYYGTTNKSQKEARWESPEDIEALKQYVSDGGILILTGDSVYNLSGEKRSLKKLQEIIGFGSCWGLKSKSYQSLVFTAEGKDLREKAGLGKEPLNLCADCVPCEITNGKVLAQYAGADVDPEPAILLNTIGKGKVYFVPINYFSFCRFIKNVGDTDDQGRFILNEDGKRVQALSRIYTAIFLSTENLSSKSIGLEQGEWGVTPLGTPGKLIFNTKKGRKPEFKKQESPKAVFLLAENGQAKAVIVHGGMKPLAQELKRHLDKMTDADFQIADHVPAEQPAIIFQQAPSLPPETAIARTQEKQVILSGSGIGTRLAMVYFLEKLGCRYLWPGENGKVIPHKKELYAPEMNLNMAPALEVRGIRNPNPSASGRTLWGMKACGINEPEEQKLYCRQFAEQSIDMKGNMPLGAWHGMGARQRFNWGHAFGYFWKKYGKDHPEYFALQSNGSRDQSQSAERSRLCMGNPAVAGAVAQDVLDYFGKNPKTGSCSICLNDGGQTDFCMCTKCRKLDPANAYPMKMTFFIAGQPQSFQYVSLTDRMLAFANQIAEHVTAKYPDKLLSVYLYSVADALPTAVRPHPALIFVLTGQSYINERYHQQELENYLCWTSFGNKVFFRPNALWGHYTIIAPQNYARKMFNDLEFYKANGLLGTDYDCLEQQWSGKGLIYYALLKAHWNPDRMSYDDIFDDYCHSGFGAAAPEVKAYWNLLEKLTDQAADTGKPYLEFFNEKSAMELAALLDAAEKKVQTDPECLARVKFLRLGLTAGEYTVALQKAQNTDDKNGCQTKLKEFRSWIRRTALESPFVLQPGTIYRNQHLK